MIICELCLNKTLKSKLFMKFYVYTYTMVVMKSKVKGMGETESSLL